MNPFFKFLWDGKTVYETETCKDTLEPEFIEF